MSTNERVRAIVEPAVAAAGLVLEDVTVTPAGARRVVRVVVDLPDDEIGGLSLDDLAVVSRALDTVLDADTVALGSTPYVLEVGTPGTSRPLTQRRHWSRARTRLVRVEAAGREVTGRVVSVDDGGVVLEVGGAQRAVPWDDLGTGRLELEFSRPGEIDEADEIHDADEADEADEPDEPDEADEHGEE